MHDDDKTPIAMTLEQTIELAARVAEELKTAGAALQDEKLTGTGGGSRHRGLPEDLRTRFINVRAALFQRGIFDPVLVRFDTATVTQASTTEVADQLASLASSLAPAAPTVTER